MMLFLALSGLSAAYLVTASNNFFLKPLRKMNGVTDEHKFSKLNHHQYRGLFLSFGFFMSTLVSYTVIETVFNHIYSVPSSPNQLLAIEEENLVMPIIEKAAPSIPQELSSSKNKSYHNPKVKNTPTKTTPATTDTVNTLDLINLDNIDNNNIPHEVIAKIKLPSKTNSIDTIVYKTRDSSIISNAHFKGGITANQKYLERNIVFPDDLLAQETEEKVFIHFIVNHDGSISEVRILKGSSFESFNKEALRVIKDMPRWEPAIKKDSTPVRQSIIQPIDFKVTDF